MQAILFPFDQNYVSDWTKTAIQVTTTRSVLGGLVCVNKSASTFWIQVFDVADTPTSEKPVLELPVFAGSYCPIGYTAGRRFANGIYVRVVTAADGSSAIAATDAKFDINYRGCW